MEIRFTHIGKGNMVQANRVMAVIRPYTSNGKRIMRQARDSGKFLDATLGNGIKSLILMDDGTVVASLISTMTIGKRLNTVAPDESYYNEETDDESEETEDEDR